MMAWTLRENAGKWIAAENYTVWSRSYTKEGKTQRKMLTNRTKTEEDINAINTN